MSDTFAEKTVKFRPEFGNKKHLQILDSLARVTEIENQLKKRKTDLDGLSTLEKEAERIKKNILFLLEN